VLKNSNTFGLFTVSANHVSVSGIQVENTSTASTSNAGYISFGADDGGVWDRKELSFYRC
jgi:hypothetical protein